MRLLESDEDYLVRKRYSFDVAAQGAELHVIIHDFPLPDTYSVTSVDLLVRLPAGYPNANPDMFWTDPRVTLTNGQLPKAAQVNENHGGRTWQRWSRHWATTWRPGIDGLGTFLIAVRNELSKGI
jgi:hypothetical protein